MFATGANVLNLTRKRFGDLIGTPFEYGGRGDTLDCYGLVMLLHREAGIELPDFKSPSDHARIAAMMALERDFWAECSPDPGAVVLFRIGRHAAHVGVVIENDRFIHTWEQSNGVIIERLSDWKNRIVGFYEYVGQSA